MSTPTYVRTWVQKLDTGVPGERIAYVSLIDTMQNYIYGIKTFLLANGYSLLWSSSAGTGPTNSGDLTDRIASASDFTPRATIAAASQAWFVLTDGNGAQLMITYQGASDDIARITYSPGALFVLAGTTNQQPTATDECIISSAATLIDATTSADRVWHGWATADGKNCRFAVYRSGVLAGQLWGLELFVLPTLPGNVSFTPVVSGSAVWGFCFRADQTAGAGTAAGAYSASVRGGLTHATISSVDYKVQSALSAWSASNVVAPQVLTTKPALQGTIGYTPWPLTLISIMGSADGYVGALVDWYLAPVTDAGNGFGAAYNWIQEGGLLWPNPSLVAPTIA